MTDPTHPILTRTGGSSRTTATPGRRGSSLPPSLLRQRSRRLRILALVVLAVNAVGWAGVNLLEGELKYDLREPVEWVPQAVMILSSIAVYLLARSSRVSQTILVASALGYEVLVSYSIPISQYWDAFAGLQGERLTSDLVGASGVIPWMLVFTVLMPVRPRDALIALIFSGAAVPLTIHFLIRIGNSPPIPFENFFYIFVLPYALGVIGAYLAARVMYGMGKDIGRAQELGSYHLLEKIGEGGMGEVWRARHHFLARPAAIKLIRREAPNPDLQAEQTALARFEREAQVTAGLQSPHTVELYDFGIADDGTLYYVMELLEGMDLERTIQRYGPLPPERVIHVLVQACHSLGEAHRQGLVHRDIKPANLYICRRAFESDFVKVLDFGLVKSHQTGPRGRAPHLTGDHSVPGTPAYLAPEIALGKSTVDGRADLYGLGGVAFWLLTGRRVFEAETPMDMIIAHTKEPPPPSSRYAEGSVPADLDTLVSACLAKEPGDRPQTAEDLSRRLRNVRCERPWTPDRAEVWWQTHLPHAT